MLRLGSLLALLLFAAIGQAQLTADFTANNTSGCAPLVVTFTDQSSGSGIIYREWQFGYGGNISSNNNSTPSSAYPVPGTYSVTLTISNGSDTASIVKPNYITVYDKPNVSFSFSPTGGCAPVQVSFSNNSTAGSGTISAYQWDFDDGSAFSSQTNPNHTYSSAGNFTPTLKVTNSFGCTKTAGNSSVNVSNGPEADFTSSTAQACTPPLTVNFTNQSNGIGPMTYAWDLDVSTSTAQNPAATYNSAGFYDIQLIVTDAYSCKDTIVKNDYVKITEVEAEFEIDDPVCAGEQISITNSTVGAGIFNWAWGDGTVGYGMNPYKAFSSGGTYTVTLTAVSGNCSDTYTQTVDVQEIDADFTASPSYGCEFPHEATYTNTSTVNFGSISSVTWRLRDRDGPLGDYFGVSDSGATVTIQRDYPGNYYDTIIVVSNAGCTAEYVPSNALVLEELIADFNLNPRFGCVPVQVTFTDWSVPTPTYPIVSWYYDFDNGSTASTANAITNYLDTGCYNPKLVIENAFGCKDSIVLTGENQENCYGTQQNAISVVPMDTMCADDTASLQSLATDSAYITEYIWGFFEDSLWNENAFEESNGFFTWADTGWMMMRHIVGHHKCYDTTYYDSAFYVQGPIVQFVAGFDCDTPMTRTILPTVWKDVQRFYWDFGDGSPIDSVNMEPVHVYQTTGDFTITLTAYNDSNGCMDEWTSVQAIRNIKAGFVISNYGELAGDTVACLPHTFNFDADTASKDEEANLYFWIFGNDTLNDTDEKELDRFYSTSGYHDIMLSVGDINGCFDTISKSIFISNPKADFDFNFTGGCDPVEVQFLDSSTSDTTIVEWQWYLGDASGFHYEQNPLHDYQSAGNYQIRLTITDSIGCTDMKVKFLPVSLPFVGFSVDTTLCQFSNVQFTNLSNGDNLQYFWNLGNGVTSTFLNPSTLYIDTGKFEVMLAIEDSLGCLDTAYQTLHVQNKPVPDFDADTTFSPCLPLTVIFTDHTTSSYVDTWEWEFGDGSASVELDTNVAFHTYDITGKFDVNVRLTTTYGCKNDQERLQYIDVSGPYAEFDLAPDSICRGDEVAFYVINRSELGSYRWVFGDGEDTLVGGNVDTVYHRYTDTIVGNRTPVVVYFDSANECQIPVIDSLYIHAVSARYSFEPDSIGCGVLNTKLINESLGDDQFGWNFGDGRTSETKSPLVYYPNPGEYMVTLWVVNKKIGCKDSMTIPFVVYPIPQVEAFGDTLICLFDSALIRAQSNATDLTWQWIPERFADNPKTPVTAVWPDSTTYFKAVATDTNECVGVDSVKVVVQQEPRLDLISDTTVIIGEEFPVLLGTPDSLLYSWQPPEAYNCPTCKNPIFKAEATDWYSVIVQDVYGCFQKEFEFRVEVIEKYSVDMPDVFTPNGDGVNDLVLPRGWGIQELVEYKIFNRWGQEVFSTTDLKQGWDGTFNGNKQQVDTYAYVVRVKFYDNEEESISGFIELIR